MRSSESASGLREVRGGRPPQFEAIQVQASALADTVSAYLLDNPEPDELNALLKQLFEVVQQVADQPALKLPSDPLTLLTDSQLGRALNGLGDDMVRIRETDGALFSVMPLGRKRGRLYPAFQAWEGIAGNRLAQVLSSLRGLDGDTQLQFFSERCADLEGLTPVEMLSGKLLEERSISGPATASLNRGVGIRIGRVMVAARTFFQKNT